MRMQKEEKIVVVLLLMSLSSLAIADWTFSGPETVVAQGSEAAISLEGRVLDLKPTRTGGNLIIKLNSTSLPIFVARDSGAAEIQSRIHAGDPIRIKGMPSKFNGVEEIVVERPSDIEVIR